MNTGAKVIAGEVFIGSFGVEKFYFLVLKFVPKSRFIHATSI